jgi:hypothetical protein
MLKPKYPIYIISKGRFDNCLTADFFVEDKVDFKLVVEPQEANEYSKRYGEDRVLILPFSNLGLGGIPARNWVWEHAKTTGAKRHWILDDNIRMVRRKYQNKRIRCNANYAFACVEEFTDRYENIAIAGLNYQFFVVDNNITPFFLNVHVYSCLLIDNSLPYRWRGRYNEDTDLCLQVLSGGLCTVLVNAFMIEKMRTMTMKGGNSDQLYKADGRLKMARSLERQWPGVVETKRRFERPQHHIKGNWGKFTTPLIRRKDIDWDKLKTNEHGMTLIKLNDIKSKNITHIYESYGK